MTDPAGRDEGEGPPPATDEGSAPRGLLRTCAQIVKVSRPGFYPTHLWFYLLPFATRDMFSTPAFWVGAVYVCFPLGLLLYGWNDLGDVESDRDNDRKDSWLFGAKPDARLRRKLPGWIAAVQAPFLIAFVAFAGAKMLLWFAGVLLVNFTYNTLRFKEVAVLDLANQVGYLLVFVLASWLCDVPQLNAPATVFSALFAMQSHLFGQLMDIDVDAAAGRRSTAVLLGMTPAKWLLVGIMAVEVAIAATSFQSSLVAWFMGAGVTYFVADTLFGPRRYPLWFTKTFFVLWNVVAIVTMHWVWSRGLLLT